MSQTESSSTKRKTTTCSNRISSRQGGRCWRNSFLGRKCGTIFAYLLLLSAASILTCALEQHKHDRSGGTQNVTSEKQTNDDDDDHDDGETSLFYTRLRYDTNYLPIYKNLQHKLPYLERTVPLADRAESADGYDNGDHYYVNPNISLHDLTQNELILEALDQVYRSRLVQSYEWSYDNSEDRKRSADPRKVNPERCNRELDYLSSRLKWARRQRGLTPELAAFFDSFATQESGVLLGNVYWLGNWKQCQKRHVFEPKFRAGGAVSFTGRFCVASMRPEEWLSRIDEKVAHLRQRDYFKFANQEFHYRQHFRIQLGICLPESCDSSIIDTRQTTIQELTRMRLGPPYDSYNLTDLFCLPDETSPLRAIPTSGRLLIWLSVVWLLLILLSTFADAYDLVGLRAALRLGRGRNFVQRIVTSLSLITSYQHLNHVSRPITIISGGPIKPNGIYVPPPPPPQTVAAQEAARLGLNQSQSRKPTVKTMPLGQQQAPAISDLHFLDAFKVLATMSILLGHIGMIILQFSQYQLDFHVIGKVFFHFLASTAFYVDWFFCMTGFIMAYGSFVSRSVYTNRAAHWLYSVFHRYWRLAPIYVLTFWFCRSLFQYTSYGPLWDYGTSNASLRSICQQESWWTPLTLSSNWHPLHRECIMPAWYIANDMQFYLITPALLLLLAHWPRLGWLSMIGMVVASVIGRARVYWTDSRVQHLELLHPRFDLIMRNNWDLHHVYLRPHYRIAPYLIGLLAGHYAFMVKSGQWSSPFTPSAAAASANPLMVGVLANNGNISQPAAAAASRSKKPLLKGKGGKLGLAGAGQLRPAAGWWSCWRTNRALLAWFGLLFTCMMSMMSGILDAGFSRSLEPYAKLIVTVIYSVGHSLAGCGLAALFLALLLGHWQPIRQLMEWPIWTRLAKINFFVYLFQMEIITWANNAQNRLPEAHPFEQFRLLFMLGPLLYALAWLVTLLVANPLAKLELEFVGVYMRVNKPVAAAAAANQRQTSLTTTSNLLPRVEREKQEQVLAAAAAAENRATPNGGAVEVLDGPKPSSSSAVAAATLGAATLRIVQSSHSSPLKASSAR